MNIDYFINGFNEGDDDVLNRLYATFGGIKNFIFGYVYKKGRLKDIDLNTIWNSLEDGETDDINKICMLYLKEFGPDYFIKYFNWYESNYLEKEGNDYYIKLKYLSDIRDLFVGPNMDFIGGLFGEDWYEPFYAETSDLYEDVVSVLNKENKKYLAKVILEKTKDVTLSEEDIVDYSGGFYLILLDYLNEDGVFSFHENISAIMNNEDNLFNEVIMMKYFGELQRDLENLYSLSYNEAWNEEMMDIVLDSISEYFDPNITWEKDMVKIKVKLFGETLKRFFEVYSDTEIFIEDFGDYFNFMRDLQEIGGIQEFQFRTLEYPDFRKVNQEINERLFDYVE